MSRLIAKLATAVTGDIASTTLLPAAERELTHAPHGHILTNTGVWSPDGQWIVFDARSDATGSVFDGKRIEAVKVATGEVKTLYESKHGACCGVVTFDPRASQVVFILGPENPTPDWQYSASHRQGVLVDFARPGVVENLDACDLTPPFTPGALRRADPLRSRLGCGGRMGQLHLQRCAGGQRRAQRRRGGSGRARARCRNPIRATTMAIISACSVARTTARPQAGIG